MYTDTMRQSVMTTIREACSTVNFMLLAFLFGSLFWFFAFPSLASAQFVPVRDVDLNPAFTTYSTNFDTYAAKFDQYMKTDTDSLRNIIAGGDPQGVALQDCKQSDVLVPVYAYTTGSWASSSDEIGTSLLPLSIPDEGIITPGTIPAGRIKMNASASTRCLLQEIVEWQKLGLSIQIHSLLKTYIADAQTKQLNNQLMNKVAGANLAHAKAGNKIDDNGIISSEAIYSTNRSKSEYNKKQRELNYIMTQAAADPASGGAVGSLGLGPWRLDTTADMVRNNRSQVEDPADNLDSQPTKWVDGYIAPNDYGKFSESFNNPANIQGGLPTFLSTINYMGNSPLGASTAADFAIEGRLARATENSRIEETSTGYVPTKECFGGPSDPNCLDRLSTAISPAAQNERSVGESAQQGNQQIQDGNTLDGTAGSTTEMQSTEINTKSGLLGYDETDLVTSQTAVNKLVQEFYDTIQYGYFGIDNNPSLAVGGTAPTRDWAQGTMLMIYDEMKFDATNPQVVVTADTAAVDTQY